MKITLLWKKFFSKKRVINKTPELKKFEPLVLIYDLPKKQIKLEESESNKEINEDKILKKRTFTMDIAGHGSGFFKSKKLNVIMEEIEQPEVSALFKNILSNTQK